MPNEDEKRRIQQSLVTRVLKGDGVASQAGRQGAFENTVTTEPLKGLLYKVAKMSSRITDEDIAAVKDSGFSEDQMFELIVCAAIGQAARQYESGLDALSKAVPDEKGISRET